MNIEIPPELVELIVKASLEPYNPVSFDSDPNDRYSTLKSYSLVNSTWSCFSTPLLYEYVVITTASASLVFFDTWEAKVKDGRVPEVRSMRLEGTLGFNRTARLLEYVGRSLETLALQVDVDVEDFAPLQKLKRLFLSSLALVSQVDFVPTFSLPLLAHLDCSDVLFRNSSTPFFNPTFTPSLRALFLHRISAASLVELDAGFAQTVPTLQCMSVDSLHVYQTVLPLASNLLLIDFDGNSSIYALIPVVRAAPRFLRVYAESFSSTWNTMRSLGGLQSKRMLVGLEQVFVDCDAPEIATHLEERVRLEFPTLKFQHTNESPLGSSGFWSAVDKVERIIKEQRRADWD